MFKFWGGLGAKLEALGAKLEALGVNLEGLGAKLEALEVKLEALGGQVGSKLTVIYVFIMKNESPRGPGYLQESNNGTETEPGREPPLWRGRPPSPGVVVPRPLFFDSPITFLARK